jgi:hypothetical protein
MSFFCDNVHAYVIGQIKMLNVCISSGDTKKKIVETFYFRNDRLFILEFCFNTFSILLLQNSHHTR